MSYMNITEDDFHGLQNVLDRSTTDPAFRQQLIADPISAIAAVTGNRLHADFRIRFIEKDRDLDALVVLPDVVDEQAELTEAELAAVAGGAMQEEEAICWGTCDKTCTDTCLITSVGVAE